ncbi:aspartate aminotransferase family protein [Paenalkalicoccus suaedae]|uniref:Acetylornithine aminotransferase n=1 Tax=Paenalkalicoccus suaedae TaxID=2592382 RepID=A0A859FG96_9BACI|nr:aspartate aminotransferase family protein [Paenalkalicoccus suaedae]QKS71225.1 aspartate aminotransferase family protein [Paenalkalicoccus suaedae]
MSNSSSVMNTYARFDITLERGHGSYVYDTAGTKYLDFTSGIATCNLGHTPTIVVDAITTQAHTLMHVSNLYHIPLQEKLAKLLTNGRHLEKVFFCNSGAEANEAAIKLAKKYANDHGHTEKNGIVSLKQSFHGRTGSTMAATGQDKIHQGFTPLTPGFSYMEMYGDLKEHIDPASTCAIMIELIQGEGGVRPVSQAWVQEVATYCEQYDILLIVDEIQTGAGRTGTFYAYEQYGISPDIVTTAKGIGSGFPVGAMMATATVAESMGPGTHGSTFGGNPLAMAAGVATVEAIQASGFLEEVKVKATYFIESLKKLVPNVRGEGFLIGIEFDQPVMPLIKELQQNGILTLPAGPNVLRVLPPLTVTIEELDHFTEQLAAVLSKEDVLV